MSEKVNVRIELPDDIISILGVKNLNNEARLLIAIELYREGKISLGKAAEIANLNIREFLYELRKREIPINYDSDEFTKDMEVIGGFI
ncbi:MAG: UPF0175 family protein [Archaeoglobaceae archaeon]